MTNLTEKQVQHLIEETWKGLSADERKEYKNFVSTKDKTYNKDNAEEILEDAKEAAFGDTEKGKEWKKQEEKARIEFQNKPVELVFIKEGNETLVYTLQHLIDFRKKAPLHAKIWQDEDGGWLIKEGSGADYQETFEAAKQSLLGKRFGKTYKEYKA